MNEIVSNTRLNNPFLQCNAAMVLAKPLSSKPRDVATRLVECLGSKLGGVCETPEIAGPGFINLKLRDDFVTDKLRTMVADKNRLGIQR